jgi:23S rRNA pseudouridine2605 synthase
MSVPPNPTMQERLQKIIARAGIASRRHAEQLILSGQVRVNGHIVKELGTKADSATDRIVAAGTVITAAERQVYILLNKPSEVVAAMADPQGRKTLRNCLRGMPERVYPVGSLDYAASGLLLMTNDGDLTAALLKNWANLLQTYHVKIKGRLTLEDLDRLGKEAGARMRTIRQPDSTRGRAANFWYEVTMPDARKESLINIFYRERHPAEKWVRIAIGPIHLEGIPRGRYRLVTKLEVEALRKAATSPRNVRKPKAPDRSS